MQFKVGDRVQVREDAYEAVFVFTGRGDWPRTGVITQQVVRNGEFAGAYIVTHDNEEEFLWTTRELESEMSILSTEHVRETCSKCGSLVCVRDDNCPKCSECGKYGHIYCTVNISSDVQTGKASSQ